MSDLNIVKKLAYNMFSNSWMEWKHIPMGLIHCATCIALDRCWFQDVDGIKRQNYRNMKNVIAQQ